MKMRALFPIVLFLAAAGGCSSSGSIEAAGSSGGGAGSGGFGAGGMVIVISDAAAMGTGGSPTAGDAGNPSQVPANLSPDAPTFNWDTKTCTGCDTGGTGGGAGVAGAGGRTGSGGSGGKGGSGPAGGSTGTTSRGGATGTGGSAGGGGASGLGGSTSRPDASVSQDARAADAPPSSVDGGVVTDAAGGGPDTMVPSPDLAPADTLKADSATTSRCTARIRALVPATDALAEFPLVAGTNTQVVLRAEVLSGGPASPKWTWQASRDGTPVSASPGSIDPAAAQFAVASAGTYTFTVVDQTTCVGSVKVTAVAANACPACDRSVILRAAPPPGTSYPVQSGAIGLTGSAPFSGTNVVLATGTPVTLSPSVGSSLVPAYVRINNQSGDRVADGLSDPRAGFGALLLAMDNNRTLLRYDVLVVPLDGTNGGTVAATAPQLFESLQPDQMNAPAFALSGGITVWGDKLWGNGGYVQDARIILTNRDPKAPVQPSDLIFSSVGRTDAQGNCLLHAQPGQYWVSISPPADKGLSEALAPAPVTLAGNATVSFQWNPITMTTFSLDVRDVNNALVDGARVRLTSSATTTVGTLTVADSGGNLVTQAAQGNVRVEGTTASGSVTFTNLPAGATYDVLIVPPALGPAAATTLLTLTVPAGPSTQTVQVVPQGRIAGNLLWGNPAVASDWSKVNLVAYDRSADTPESPRAVSVNPDGSFIIGASPGRPYIVIAVPDTTSGLARTFVGPGPLEASEFSITQKVQASRTWSARVMGESQSGSSGTALQVFCGATWPSCIDSTIPLAETTSGDGGAFDLALPDPSTR